MDAILNKLEYNEIIKNLGGYCKTYLGKNLCEQLVPNFSYEQVDFLLTKQNKLIHFYIKKVFHLFTKPKN